MNEVFESYKIHLENFKLKTEQGNLSYAEYKQLEIDSVCYVNDYTQECIDLVVKLIKELHDKLTPIVLYYLQHNLSSDVKLYFNYPYHLERLTNIDFVCTGDMFVSIKPHFYCETDAEEDEYTTKFSLKYQMFDIEFYNTWVNEYVNNTISLFENKKKEIIDQHQKVIEDAQKEIDTLTNIKVYTL